MINVIIANTKEILKECLFVRNQVFTMEKGVPADIEVDEQDVLNGDCDHFLIIYNEVPVGALRCKHLDGNKVKLQRFCIFKEYREMSIGKEAVRLIEEIYKEKSVDCVEIDSKYHVYEFYEKCGYEKVSDVFIEADVPHVKMIKKIV